VARAGNRSLAISLLALLHSIRLTDPK
jgi:hypothetical protein